MRSQRSPKGREASACLLLPTSTSARGCSQAHWYGSPQSCQGEGGFHPQSTWRILEGGVSAFPLQMDCKGCSPFPQGPSKLGSPLPDAEVLGKGLWSQQVNAMGWGDAEMKVHTPGSTQDPSKQLTPGTGWLGLFLAKSGLNPPILNQDRVCCLPWSCTGTDTSTSKLPALVPAMSAPAMGLRITRDPAPIRGCFITGNYVSPRRNCSTSQRARGSAGTLNQH